MTQLRFPPGRMVFGDVYKPVTTDYDGNTLVIKDGPNKGQPTQYFQFGVAFPKNGAQHFSQTEWGAVLWAEGHQSFANGAAQRPDFSWKVVDGDSTIVNKKNNRPCDKEGYPGHFVVTFRSSYPPKLTTADGMQQLTTPDAIKCGYFVQVFGSVAGNKNTNNPGIYINHDYVALSFHGEVIHTGIDPKTIGFGAGGYVPPGAIPVPAYNPNLQPQAPAGYAPPPPPPGQYQAPGAPAGYAPPPPPPGQYQAPGAPAGYAPPPPPPGQYQAPGAPAGYAPPGALPQHGAPPGYNHPGVNPVPSFLHGPQ